MIKSYWLRLLLFIVAGAGIGLVVSVVSPKKYEAIMQIMIDQAPPVAPQVTSEAAGQVIDIKNFSRPRSVATQVEQLTAFGILGTAARNARAALRANDDDEELQPDEIQNSLTVSADATSDIITLRIRLSTPERARIVAREIYQAFAGQSTDSSKDAATRASASIGSMLGKLRDQLTIIDSRLETLRSRGAVDPINQLQQLFTSIERLKDARDGLLIEYAGQLKRRQGLVAELAKTTEKAFQTDSSYENPAIQNFKTQIATAKAQRAAALNRYMEDHPIIKEIDLSIENLNAEIKRLEKQEGRLKGGVTTAANPIRQNLQGLLATVDADIMSLKDKIAESNATLAAREREQQRWPRIQNEYQKLLREQVALEKKYTDARAELASTQAMDRARTAPSELVTEPTAMPDPVSPKHFINTLFGLVGGLILGVLSMLSTEGRRQPIRSLAHLNSLASQPVYRIIPELRMPFRGLNKPPAEPYETLLVNFRRSEKRPYRMGIVGITKDAGASITSLNVALAAEKHGNRALIVETDERSTIRRLLHRQGISVEGQVSHVTPFVSLYTVDALRQVQNADGTTDFGADIATLESDLTVVDFEPATESAEYAFAASHLDEVVVLVRAERTKSVEFLHAQQALAESGCPVVTVVFARSSDLQLVTDAVESYEAPKALTQ